MKPKLKEIIAPMTPKEKVSYIWEYYKFHILGTIGAVLLIIYLIVSVVDKKDVFLQVTILGNGVNTEEIAPFQEHLTDKLVTDKAEEEVNVQSIAYNPESMDQASQLAMQKFAAEVSTGNINVMIIEQELFQELISNESLLALNELEGFSEKNVDEKALLKSGETVYGITASVINGLTSLELDENKVICVPNNTKNLERINQFFTMITSS